MATINSTQSVFKTVFLSFFEPLFYRPIHEIFSCMFSGLSFDSFDRFTCDQMNSLALSMISKTFYFEHLSPCFGQQGSTKCFGNCRVVGALIEENDIPAIGLYFSDGSIEYYSIAELSISHAKPL